MSSSSSQEGAQLTLARNRIARPDVVKRPYLLRGLMKCSHCGHSFIGTVSQGKMIGKLSNAERNAVEVRGDFVLRPYYMCNGKNLPHRVHGPDALGCPSGHLRAKELETLVWDEIEGFLSAPEKVMEELAVLLRDRLGEGAGQSELFKELDELRAQSAGTDGERNSLYRLFRKGTLRETDLESQLRELKVEEEAVAARLEKVERAVAKARDAKASLDGARAQLHDLKLKIAADDSWSSRRRAVETLVAGVEIETHFDGQTPRRGKRTVTLRISYRFETPDLEELTPQAVVPYSGRTGHTAANVLGLTLLRTHADLSFGFDPFAMARDAARELLQNNPSMIARDVAAKVLSQTGETISPASISRLRHQLLKQSGSHMENAPS